MMLKKFAIAAFALSATGVMANATDKDTSKQTTEAQQPAGYADKSPTAAPMMAGQKDTKAAQGQSALTANTDTAAGTNGASATANGSTANSSATTDASTQSSTNGSMAAGDENVREVQQALAQAGHDPGPVDGQMGPSTKRALKDYQQAKGIEATGELDQATTSALGIQAK
jgi:hypothetical protein